MKSRYRLITKGALVVPMQEPGRPYWSAQMLPAGTIVRLVNAVPSAITHDTSERTVRWLDIIGRETTGWLAKNAALGFTKEKKLYLERKSKLGPTEWPSAWDHLRHMISMNEGWDAKKWIAVFGSARVPLLHAVIRELGGKVPVSDDPLLAISRTLRLILNKEIRMSDIKKARKNAKSTKSSATEKADVTAVAQKKSSKGKKSSSKTKTKASTKRAAKNDDETVRAGRKSAFAGKRIVRLVKENPRREGSKGFRNWKLYKKGMTYEQFLDAGGQRGCLAVDIKRGNVKVVKA